MSKRKVTGKQAILAHWLSRAGWILVIGSALITLVHGMGRAAPIGASVEPLPVSEVAPQLFVAQGAVAIADPHNQGFISNMTFIIGNKGIAVVDTGGSFLVGMRLKAAIRQKSDLPILYVINTHAHPDHVFGNAAFVDTGAEFIAHANFNRALKERGSYYLPANQRLIGADGFTGTQLVQATRLVEKAEKIDLGERILSLTPHPTAHTDNDLSVVDEKTRTAILGDMLFVHHIPALDGRLKGWIGEMIKLKSQKFDQAVPGHGSAKVPWPQSLEPQLHYLQTLVTELRQQIADGVSINDASTKTGLSERDAWILFDEFNTRNATTGYAELEWE